MSNITGSNRSDRLYGTNEDDVISGRNGNDYLYGFDGNDVLNGDNGRDVIYGGNGSDTVDGGKGDDAIVHYVNDAADDADRYDGGRDNDTLYLSFTEAQWAAMNGDDYALRSDILNFITDRESDNGVFDVSASYTFETMDLQVQNFESVVVFLGGYQVGWWDLPAVAEADAFEITEDTAPLALDVTANDDVPDGVVSVSVTEGPAKGSVSVADNVVTFDAGDDFGYLSVGQTENVTFTYEVADYHGDTDTAEVTVTVAGANDGPTANDVNVTIDESESDVSAFDVAFGPQTIINAGGFYVLDFDTGEMAVVERRAGALTQDEVAPLNGAVVYINPNTANFFVQATAYSEGVGTAVDPASFVLGGFDGPTQISGDSLFALAGGTDMTLDIEIPSVMTPDGEASIDFSLTGLDYDPDAALKTVEVDGTTASVEPAGNTDTVIAPDATDPDAADTLTYSVDTTGTEGEVTVNEDGTFTYDQGNAFGYLAVGETATDTFSYTADDGNGGTDDATVTVTVNGTNDAPDALAMEADVFVAGSAVQPFEDGAGPQEVPNAGYFYVADYDSGAVYTVARSMDTLTPAEAAPMNGIVVHINPNTANLMFEAATYSDGVETMLDPATLVPSGYTGEFDTYQDRIMLNEGFDGLDLTVEVSNLPTPDGFADMSLTLAGIDYAGPGNPIVANVAGASVSAEASDVATSVTIEAIASDPDASDMLTYTVDTWGTLGNVMHDGEGTFTYSAGDAFAALEYGEVATDTFTYTVSDGNGGFDTETVTINAIGVDGDDFALIG